MKATKDEVTGKWTLEGDEDYKVTYSRMLDYLKSNKPFKFARYGDGELNANYGKIVQNCDGHKYFPDLRVRLMETVEKEPDYMVGIQPLSVQHLPNQVSAYFEGWKLYNADVLHNASIDKTINKFFEVLDGRYIILVGP